MDQKFGSLEQLKTWVYQRALACNFVIVTKRTISKSERTVKIWLCCDCGGEYNSTATKRRSGSKKVGCPFTLVGRLDSKSGTWKLKVKEPNHNHVASQHLEGHAFARRLTPNEEYMVESLYSQNLEPANILLTIRNQNPQSMCILQDIYNVIKKFKFRMYAGRTPMQVLEQHLAEKEYNYFTRENPSTNVVEDIFFVHPHSLTLWRAFPHVLMIDTTYKTNEYKLPFVQVIDVTSTHKSFCVAHAFISKEKQDNFLWVLEKLRDMLQECMEPRVIITDRDLALMNACDKVFPNASKLLCRWHISQNILKHCKAKFSKDDWKIFKLSWARLCQSHTQDIYEYNYNRLYERLHNEGRKEVMDYVCDVWLKNYKERFVSLWTNTNHNFGQHTANRVESQHANLKRYLKGHNSSLHRPVLQVDKILESQVIAIKHSFQKSLFVPMGDHKIPMFD
ncbi:putative MULE transposase domain, FHY3/FAR1 family [Helianthus debilis subsp. tardiflorus]